MDTFINVFAGKDDHLFTDVFLHRYFAKIKETKTLPGCNEPIENETMLKIKTLSRLLFIMFDVFEFEDKTDREDHKFVFAAENTEEGVKTLTYCYDDFIAGKRDKTYDLQSVPDCKTTDILSSLVYDDEITVKNIYEVLCDIVWEWLFPTYGIRKT